MSSKHKIACGIVASAALLSLLWAISSMEFCFPALSPAGANEDFVRKGLAETK